MGRNLAVELILDQRDEDIDCKIVKVVNGKKADAYDIDDRGRRVREGLANLLMRRGVREPLFTKVGKLNLREQIPITVRDFATMLRRHGQDVLADSPTALNS
jgi:hypothetical protein